ncbi:MAG: RNA-binding S4 domain-containing protein [Alphaproteobacteria bacterium]|nr:RNA-binding S4 domain-containing protein [Alphaproteobacteria bacterium]
MTAVPVERMRLDKWLWCARFFKSRSLAARFVEETGVRIAGASVLKPHHAVRPGDVLTFALGSHIRVVRVRTLSARRGPPPEARGLYDDLDRSPAGPASDRDG